MNKEMANEIVLAGKLAPSGDNAQPWSFVVGETFIDIYKEDRPQLDHPFYNFRQLGTYLACGAAIENMVIAATKYGLRTTLSFFSEQVSSDKVARLTFQSGENPDPLITFIEKRHTNRKPHKKDIRPEQGKLDELNAIKIGSAEAKLLTDQGKIQSLGQALAVNESVALEVRELHSTFFSHIAWTREDEKKKKGGLYIKTLEVPPPIQILFRILKYWPIQKLFNLIGFSKMAAKTNGKVYGSSHSFVAIVTPGISVQEFINAGRVMERVWLIATKYDLAVQPVTGILYLSLRISEGKTFPLRAYHIAKINEAYKNIISKFEVSNVRIPMLLRIGIAPIATAISHKSI